MTLNAIQHRILRHPAEQVTGPASLPAGIGIANDRTLAADRNNRIGKVDQMRLATAFDLLDNLDMRREIQSGKEGHPRAEFTAMRGCIKHAEPQTVETIGDPALDGIETAATGEQFAIERTGRHSRLPRFRRVKHRSAARNELSASPQDPPAVEFFRQHPTCGIAPLPVLQQRHRRVHARNLLAELQVDKEKE